MGSNPTISTHVASNLIFARLEIRPQLEDIKAHTRWAFFVLYQYLSIKMNMATKQRFKIFNDILKENGVYSQGRIYLLVSVIAYYLTLGILTFAGR